VSSAEIFVVFVPIAELIVFVNAVVCSELSVNFNVFNLVISLIVVVVVFESYEIDGIELPPDCEAKLSNCACKFELISINLNALEE